ncbi:MAG TPA: endonuclease/exonuclease/phosphatase family protein [Pseudolabrys sp.]|nr:endonuclease/exonuclease/phosphatase family protein [Pseudolabrys sp.]
MKKGEGVTRVMTWNIHGIGRNPRFDLTRVVDLIRIWDPDVVALQEVDSRRTLADAVNPFEFLPTAIGIYGIGAKTIISKDGEYGQMLISRFPITAHQVHDISFREREPRRAIRADIRTPTGPLTVIATHLGLSFRERRDQARALAQLALGEATTVVMGDFNDWIWPGTVRASLSQVLGAYTRSYTFPSRFPLFSLDRIYCRPRHMLLRSYIDTKARTLSDHLPVISDLRMSGCKTKGSPAQCSASSL